MATRFKEKYEKEVKPALKEEFKYSNSMQVPRLDKIVVNMGVGKASQNAKALDSAVADLTSITGQKPLVTKTKKAISNFKVRENMPIGAKVTLRGAQMFEFMDRLVSLALPRVRDFRGVQPRSFDGQGNYNLGIKEQTIFPEINYDKVEQVQGLDIAFITTAKTDAEGKALLKGLGMPFRN
jgi:large subunit ribosomal protein L5